MVNNVKRSILLLMLIIAHSSLYAVPLKPMTVLLDWYANPNHAPILLALSAGYFSKHGLKVILIEPSDASDAAKLIAMKKADIAITYQPHYRQQRQQGLPIQQIGTLIATPLDCLVYLPSSGIHSAQDLKGKRIGYSDASSEFLLLTHVLQAAGLTLHDVTLINVHYNLTQALMMAKIDVAEGMMRNIEPVIMQQQHFSPQLFYPEKFGIAPYSELIYIAYSTKITPEMIAFLQALAEATQYLQQQPEAAWQVVIKTYPQLNTTTNHAIWQKTVPLFTLHPNII